MENESEAHISSLIVRCLPDQLEPAMAATGQLADAEVHQHDERGVFIVSLETSDESGIVEAIRCIESMSGVINTSLVFHQVGI